MVRITVRWKQIAKQIGYPSPSVRNSYGSSNMDTDHLHLSWRLDRRESCHSLGTFAKSQRNLSALSRVREAGAGLLVQDEPSLFRIRMTFDSSLHVAPTLMSSLACVKQKACLQ